MSGEVTLLVNVSGGRTSAYMAWWLKNNPEVVAEKLCATKVRVMHIFANTGFEHDDTLRFLNDLDTKWGLNLIWLEAHPYQGQRKGCEPRVVSYLTAYRWRQWELEDHPFHGHVKKYGVPNRAFPACSSTMKRDVISRYMSQVHGLTGKNFAIAIGIRADEKRRVQKSESLRQRLVYPLAHWVVTDHEDVLEFWERIPWDLRVPANMGNCITCWKKGTAKLVSVARRLPMAFDFNEAMEARYGLVRGARNPDGSPRSLTFWNDKRPTSYIRELVDMGGEETDKPDRDEPNSCSESCDFLPTETIPHTLFEELSRDDYLAAAIRDL